MVTCQSSELGWEVTLELPADFLSLGRGSVIVPLPGEAEIHVEAGSSPSHVGDLPSDNQGLEARTTKAARSSIRNI